MSYNPPRWILENVPKDVAESNLFIFRIKLPNGQQIDINMLQDVDIIYDQLEGHLEEIPAQYIFWASVYSELRSMVPIIEAKIAARKAILVGKSVEIFKAKGIKLTDKQTELVINSDDKITQLISELAITQKQIGKLYHMVEAIKMRSEHCRSLAGFKRQEKEQSSYQP